MNRSVEPGGRQTSAQRSGRRASDLALQIAPSNRERRKPPLQTDAAAQSVVMASLQKQAQPQTSAGTGATAAPARTSGYGDAATRPTEEALQKAKRKREADLQYQAAQKAWVFERRRTNKPRQTVIEDAIELPLIDD